MSIIQFFLSGPFSQCQELEEKETVLRAENDQFRQRFDLDDTSGNPESSRLRIEVSLHLAPMPNALGLSPHEPGRIWYPYLPMSQDLQRRLELTRLESETYQSQSKGKDDKIADLEARSVRGWGQHTSAAHFVPPDLPRDQNAAQAEEPVGRDGVLSQDE